MSATVFSGETEAANRCCAVLSKAPHFDKEYHTLKVAKRIAKEQPEEGLKLLEEVVTQAKQDGDLILTCMAEHHYMLEAQHLDRFEETVAMATECLEYAKAAWGDSSDAASIERKHAALETFAFACGMTGRSDESKRAFDELIASANRIFGRDRVSTCHFFTKRAIHLLKMVCKAEDLVFRDDVANSARYLDAVLIKSKAQDFFDAKDPNVQFDQEIMVVAANVLRWIGRIQESAPQ